MSESFDRNELYRLFGLSAEGHLSPADHARLEALLASSAEARRLWFQCSDIETGLADWSAVQKARDAQFQSAIASPTERAAPRRRSRIAVLATLAAGIAVLALGIAWWPRTAIEERAQGVAVLSRTLETIWEDSAESRTAGAVLVPGVLRIKSGAVLLEFYSGARLVLEGPAELRLDSASKVSLAAGRLNAHVPPQARGFTVDTPVLQLIDRGTDFGLLVAEGRAEAHVFQGAVEIKTTGDLKEINLTAGQATLIGKLTLESIPADPSAFLTETAIVEREAAGAAAQRVRWQASSRRLSRDPAAVVHFSLEESPNTDAQLRNDVPGAPAATSGRTVGCEWVAGRWSPKRALQFRGEGDRIRLRVDQPLQEITLAAWVRIQDLQRGLHALLCADTDTTGSIRWELSRSGELRFAIARDLGRAKADWEAVNSVPFVTQNRLGQWLLLVTTFDGKTVRHYGNGAPIGSGVSFRPPALLIGSADIGNWNGASVRNLPGVLDEFAVLSRALSAEEVRQLYEDGKP